MPLPIPALTQTLPVRRRLRISLAEHVDVGAMQEQLKSLKTDLDVAQRKYTLDQANYYGKTNYAADKDGAAALDDEKADIATKQQEIDAIQSKLDSLH